MLDLMVSDQLVLAVLVEQAAIGVPRQELMVNLGVLEHLLEQLEMGEIWVNQVVLVELLQLDLLAMQELLDLEEV